MGGGCIGEVYRVELEDGTTLVAKVDSDGTAHLDREAYMLRYLRAESDLPVPEVYHGSETLLLMEFVEGSSRFSEGAERHARWEEVGGASARFWRTRAEASVEALERLTRG
jgi:aminoglycoside phosphotransferase